MRISELTIKQGLNGLHESTFNGLQNIVLLTGPNGSGKSRILRTLEQVCVVVSNPAQRAELNRQLAQTQHDLRNSQNNAHREQWLRQDANTQAILASADSMKFTPDGPLPKVVDYSVRPRQFNGWDSVNAHQASEYLRLSSEEFGFGNLEGHLAPAIAKLIHSYLIERGNNAIDASTVERWKGRYDRLQYYIERLLGTPLGINQESNSPMLFGMDLGAADLSPGQCALLAVAFSLALQSISPERLVLTLDEPEIHLHPKALIEVLDQITSALPDTQLWIATHSVSVLAHYDSRCIWSVLDGQAKKAGSDWSTAIGSLLGDTEEQSRLITFLGVPARSAMLGFAASCLAPPAVVTTPSGDPQTTHTAEAICQLSSGAPPVVLDYGAGRGRLLGEFVAQGIAIDYFAADSASVAAEVAEMCQEEMRRAFPTDYERRYLTGESALDVTLADSSVDIVVMCNVLHEIDPDEWISVLGETSTIYRCLREGGHLMIVEDQILPVGEHAHKFNFLILDSPSLQELFDDRDKGVQTREHPDPRYSGRLKIHFVPKRLLANVSEKTRISAISALIRQAEARAIELEGSSDSTSGRKYGFWTMQHFNAHRALRHLTIE